MAERESKGRELKESELLEQHKRIDAELAKFRDSTSLGEVLKSYINYKIKHDENRNPSEESNFRPRVAIPTIGEDLIEEPSNKYVRGLAKMFTSKYYKFHVEYMDIISIPKEKGLNFQIFGLDENNRPKNRVVQEESTTFDNIDIELLNRNRSGLSSVYKEWMQKKQIDGLGGPGNPYDVDSATFMVEGNKIRVGTIRQEKDADIARLGIGDACETMGMPGICICGTMQSKLYARGGFRKGIVQPVIQIQNPSLEEFGTFEIESKRSDINHNTEPAGTYDPFIAATEMQKYGNKHYVSTWSDNDLGAAIMDAMSKTEDRTGAIIIPMDDRLFIAFKANSAHNHGTSSRKFVPGIEKLGESINIKEDIVEKDGKKLVVRYHIDDDGHNVLEVAKVKPVKASNIEQTEDKNNVMYLVQFHPEAPIIIGLLEPSYEKSLDFIINMNIMDLSVGTPARSRAFTRNTGLDFVDAFNFVLNAGKATSQKEFNSYLDRVDNIRLASLGTEEERNMKLERAIQRMQANTRQQGNTRT